MDSGAQTLCRLQNCGNQKPLGDTEPDFEFELGESDEQIDELFDD